MTHPTSPLRPTLGDAFAVVGHRGARGLRAENTLASFRAALDAGVDAVEFDVLLSSDGVPVVWHDPVLLEEKLGPEDAHRAGTPLQRLSALELAHLDVGVTLEGFPRQKRCEGGIERLADVLRLVLDHPSRPWILLEIKSEPTRPELAAPAEETTAAALTVLDELVAEGRPRSQVHDRVVLESFDWAAVREAGRSDPHLARAALAVGVGPASLAPTVHDASPWLGGVDLAAFDDELAAVASLDVQAVVALAPWVLHSPDPAGFVTRAHDLGLAVLPWTVNDVEEALRLRDLGCEGVVSDVPDEMRAALDSR